jgi:hypothetical protein
VSVAPAPLFRFVQLELPWELGPEDGRYVVRHHAGEPPDWVLVLATLGAAERRRMLPRARRATSRPVAAEPAPTPVPITRATVIAATPLASPADAGAWLDDADGEAEVVMAVHVLNRALHAHRVAAADPYVREVALEQALVARVGYGEGEQVADGRWARALDLPGPPADRRRRSAALRPQERLAALLGGRDAALACEELALRARADLSAGRVREASLQVRVALESALSELTPWRDRGDMRERLSALGDERPATAAFAHAAVEGGLDEARTADVARVLSAIEAALRARSALGFD